VEGEVRAERGGERAGDDHLAPATNLAAQLALELVEAAEERLFCVAPPPARATPRTPPPVVTPYGLSPNTHDSKYGRDAKVKYEQPATARLHVPPASRSQRRITLLRSASEMTMP
jgi:hypothetical protein